MKSSNNFLNFGLKEMTAYKNRGKAPMQADGEDDEEEDEDEGDDDEY